MYCYIWEYVVNEHSRERFVQEYGPSGSWCRLFRQKTGYLGTDLLQDRADPRRFVTVDRWASFDCWRAMREEDANEFDRIDAECETLTESEREIGRFDGDWGDSAPRGAPR
ncbi:MAG: antibiotic biosynthesis monooxygenase [Acidobacteriota bacterium]